MRRADHRDAPPLTSRVPAANVWPAGSAPRRSSGSHHRPATRRPRRTRPAGRPETSADGSMRAAVCASTAGASAESARRNARSRAGHPVGQDQCRCRRVRTAKPAPTRCRLAGRLLDSAARRPAYEADAPALDKSFDAAPRTSVRWIPGPATGMPAARVRTRARPNGWAERDAGCRDPKAPSPPATTGQQAGYYGRGSVRGPSWRRRPRRPGSSSSSADAARTSRSPGHAACATPSTRGARATARHGQARSEPRSRCATRTRHPPASTETGGGRSRREAPIRSRPLPVGSVRAGALRWQASDE